MSHRVPARLVALPAWPQCSCATARNCAPLLVPHCLPAWTPRQHLAPCPCQTPCRLPAAALRASRAPPAALSGWTRSPCWVHCCCCCWLRCCSELPCWGWRCCWLTSPGTRLWLRCSLPSPAWRPCPQQPAFCPSLSQSMGSACPSRLSTSHSSVAGVEAHRVPVNAIRGVSRGATG